MLTRSKLFRLIRRHAHAAQYVLWIIVPSIVRNRARPVIFSKFSGIGDIICTFPAALELMKRHPRAEFIYHCYSDFACLPKMAGITDHVTCFAEIGLVGYWYRFLLGGFYQFTSDDDRPDIVPTEIYIKDFGRRFGVLVGNDHPKLEIATPIKTLMSRRLLGGQLGTSRLVVIHSGPTWPIREWPQHSWVKLINQLRALGDFKVFQIGSAQHPALSSVDLMSIPATESLVGKLSLEESITLISLADLFIGVDSGMLHIAASVGTPSIGLWGPTSARFRFSEHNARFFVTSATPCQGCHHRVPRLHWVENCPNEIACMQSITVERVLDVCKKALLYSSAPA